MTGPHRLPIWRMVQIASLHFGLSTGDLRGPRRSQRLFKPRAAIAVVSTELGYTLGTIARALGRSDHSSAVNAIQRGRYMHARDVDFARFVATLQNIAEAYSVFGDKACVDWFSACATRVPLPPAPEIVTIEEQAADREAPDSSERSAIISMRRGTDALLKAIRRYHPERFIQPRSVPRVATGMAA